jgi:pimeloyl-ACP methyl ester carboxylesterase
MKRSINGIQLNIQSAGKGPPIVFIHGFPLNGAMWQPQLDGLSDAAQVIVPDLRAHGDSQIVPGPYSMDLFADDLAALLDALEINEPITLCGLSMGGYVAFAFFRRHRQRLEALVLAATRAGEDTAEGKSGREMAASQAQTLGSGIIVDGMLPKMLAPAMYQKNPALVVQARSIMEHNSIESYMGDLYGMRDRPDSTPTLREIDIPTLILHGREDQIFPVLEAESMHSHIPNSRLVLIPDSGHLLNLEQPELFNSAMRDFLGELES